MTFKKSLYARAYKELLEQTLNQLELATSYSTARGADPDFLHPHLIQTYSGKIIGRINSEAKLVKGTREFLDADCGGLTIELLDSYFIKDLILAQKELSHNLHEPVSMIIEGSEKVLTINNELQ